MNQQKVILSLFDHTANWSKPYINAGYPVILWDAQDGWDIIENDPAIQLDGLNVHGILSAVPCTAFAGSGARWWKDKDKLGSSNCDCCDTITEHYVTMAMATLRLVEVFNPDFWVIENPVGRIERLIPEIKPYRSFSFNPSDFGDPYPKRTILWGEFNSPVITQPVLSLFKEEIHNVAPGADRQNIRSATPMGFAKAFYEANQ